MANSLPPPTRRPSWRGHCAVRAPSSRRGRWRRAILAPEDAELPVEARPTLERFVELRVAADDRLDETGAREIVRELKAVGGNRRFLRLALTGAERGPELWAVVAALSLPRRSPRASRGMQVSD